MIANPCGTFPNVRIISTRSLLLHAQPGTQNVNPLVSSMTKEGVLRDPPIVTTTESIGKHYLVLEGADYVLALRHLKIPHILGQIVEPGQSLPSRALRVNYPLAELMNGKSLMEKNNNLTQWLRERILKRSVRCYEEATIFFDE